MVKGVYCLILKVSKPINLKVGALGKIHFEKGTYCYIGSAMNGIEQRIGRYLKLKNRGGKKFWHIDHLLTNPNVKIEKVYVKQTNKKSLECMTAQSISGSSIQVPNFGSSDCKCNSHLFKIEKLNLIFSYEKWKQLQLKKVLE